MNPMHCRRLPAGAGKSSMIETLGIHLCEAGNRVAVLAIDPSSHSTGQCHMAPFPPFFLHIFLLFFIRILYRVAPAVLASRDQAQFLNSQLSHCVITSVGTTAHTWRVLWHSASF